MTYLEYSINYGKKPGY